MTVIPSPIDKGNAYKIKASGSVSQSQVNHTEIVLFNQFAGTRCKANANAENKLSSSDNYLTGIITSKHFSWHVKYKKAKSLGKKHVCGYVEPSNNLSAQPIAKADKSYRVVR